MALTQTTEAWQSITLSVDEVWFAEREPFKVHSLGGSAPDIEDGATIRSGDSIRFAAGQTVHFRCDDGQGSSPTSFARVEVSS